MRLNRIIVLVAANAAQAVNLPAREVTTVTATITASLSFPTVPQYFQTSPEIFAGPTATGLAPFLAQSNPVFFASSVGFKPNSPLETGEPISGQGEKENIFNLMGNLSPYFPNPSGFGVSEYPLPAGASIVQVQVCITVN